MELIQRLRDHASGDHKRGCQGRCYSCECGYDGKTEPLLNEAAAEIERLRARLTRASELLGPWMSAALEDPAVCKAMKADIRQWFDDEQEGRGIEGDGREPGANRRA